jgi:predicted porin
MGTLTLGRHDLHYGKQPDDVPSKGALMASSVSLMDFAAGGATAIANATRTPNVVRWDSPSWGGVNVTLAYSTGPGAASEADLTHGGSAGRAFNINPSFTAANFQVGLSIWDQKNDGAAGASTEQESQVLYGFMRFGPFKVGAAFHRAEISGTGGLTSDRDAWTIPVSWTMGRNTVAAHITQARDDDRIAGDNKARMLAAMYAYDLSKRTAISFTYAQIKNEAAAAYDFFTNKTAGAFGSTGSAVNAGEDPQLFAVTLRHAF